MSRHWQRAGILVGYTRQWATDLVLTRTTRTPTTAGSSNPMLGADFAATAARRRWTRWVCAGFLLSLAVNVCSTTFVVVRLHQSAAGLTQQTLVERFLEQKGSEEFLSHIQEWRTPLSESQKIGSADGMNIHPNSTPVAAHMTLDPLSSSCISDSTMERVTGWQPGIQTYMKEQRIRNNPATGTVTVTIKGLYQIYSQLAFRRINDTIDNKASMTYRQVLVNGDGQILLEDSETKICKSGASPALACYVSSMFTALKLDAETELHIEASHVDCVERIEKTAFFGIFKLA